MKKPANLKSGTMVVLTQTIAEIAIHARRVPQQLSGPRGKTMSDVVITTIPHGSRALYMCTQEDAFNTALRAKGRGPYGYTPVSVYYHLVLWEGRPVWVASSDCSLEPVGDHDRVPGA